MCERPGVTPRLLADVGAALTLLTRLPGHLLVGRSAWPRAAACVWAYPLVGGLVGAAGAAVLAALPTPLGAAWALVAMVALSGGLHEDGLADMADGFGGGRSVERKLAIMRDSRVGSYAVLALTLSLLVRWAALSALATRFPAAPIAAGALSRAALIIPALLLPPARPDGLGATLDHIAPAAAGACLTLAALLTALCLPWPLALTSLAASLAATVAVSALSRHQIGGFTGDVLGASAVATEALVLSLAAA